MWWRSGYAPMDKHLLCAQIKIIHLLHLVEGAVNVPTIMVARQPENYADYVKLQSS